MIFAYGLLGVFAVIGAAIHVLFVLAIMAVIGSTMTLPGIAGIVLTIGMAVDANVLINERIREELRDGRTPISAIETGFTPRLRHHHRQPAHHLHRGPGDVLAGLGADPRVRRHTDARHHDDGLYGLHHRPAAGGMVACRPESAQGREAPLAYKPPASWKTDGART